MNSISRKGVQDIHPFFLVCAMLCWLLLWYIVAKVIIGFIKVLFMGGVI